MENPVVARVFQGVRAGVVGLIFVAALRFAKGSILNVWHLLIAGIALAVATFTNLHILVLLLFGGLAGWFIHRGTEHGYVDPTGGGDKL